jgi:hypothetical protein
MQQMLKKSCLFYNNVYVCRIYLLYYKPKL